MAKTPSVASGRKKTPASKAKATPKTNSSHKARTSSTKKSPSLQQDDITTAESILYEDNTKQYYSHVQFIPRRDKFMKSDPLSAPTFNQTDDNDTWCIRIGDTCCIEKFLNSRPNQKSRLSSQPFTVTWRACQILSLYRERIPKKLSTKKYYLGPLMIELRWFYTYAELDERNKRYYKSPKNNNKNENDEETYESDHVAIVDASVILGRLELQQPSNKIDFLKYPVPTVVRSCHRYYLHKEQDVIDLYDRGSTVSRGLECSKILQNNKSLREAAYKYLDMPLPANVSEEESLVELPPHTLKVKYTEGIRLYYASCALAYPRSQLTHNNLLCPQTEAGALRQWQLCVGDIVAVHCNESTPPSGVDAISERDKWYPYAVPWSHCQVTALYRTFEGKSSTGSNSSGSVASTSVTCQIRWFPRISEALKMCNDKPKVLHQLNEISNDTNRSWEEILEGKEVSIIDCSQILGPVSMDEHDSNLTHGLPLNRRTLSKSIKCTDKGIPNKIISQYATNIVVRGLNASTLFGKDHKKRILEAIEQSRKERSGQQTDKQEPLTMEVETEEAFGTGDIAAEDDDCSESSPHKKRQLFDDCPSGGKNKGNKKIRFSVPATEDTVGNEQQDEKRPLAMSETRVIRFVDPFHVDVSALKSFYEEVEIISPVDSYDDRFSTSMSTKVKGNWKVKLGDTVTLEVESSSKDPAATYFPFIVPWAPAEIVSIYRVHKIKESCVKLREGISLSQGSNDDNDEGEIMIEVRWLYRPWEIPGASKKKSVPSDNWDLEEVFETDQIDVASADSILSPVQLHDVTRPLQSAIPSSVSGMPLIHYHCSRLWSIHRRSFVPSGSLSNRISRGRMHSAYKIAFDQLHLKSNDGSTASTGKQSWKESFQTAIHKLSLAEAAQDTQEGMALATRQKERKQITSFLKKAICGLEGEDDEELKNLKSSLFIAGPPGTGKTASVRSIIAELQREQHEGLLPEFNFIALNGMELRHPFDAYVKFWEAVSGPRKERLSAGDAVYELENYFCGQTEENEDDSDSDSDSGSDNEVSEDEEVKLSEDEETKDKDSAAKMSEKPVTVLMLDEIDYLVTRKETLVYNFFDWPLRATTARLVVIGISNTINLPEKLSTRVQSRIGGDRCHFRSYNVQDTITILKTRLGMLGDNPSHSVFEEDAIKFAARKTANLSGDIRKAFHMCKVAAETVFEECNNGKRRVPEGSRPVVRISNVQKGSRDMFTSIVLKAVSCSTDYEALLLISLGALKKDRDDGSFPAKEILVKIESIANASGETRYMNARLSFADILGMMNRLGDAGIIQLNTYMSSPFPWVSTHLHSYEILASFRDTRHSKLAEKHLANQRLF